MDDDAQKKIRMSASDPVHDDPVVDAALDWFGRLRQADGDAALLAGFQDWLDQDPRHERAFRDLQDMWGSPAFLNAVGGLPHPLVAQAEDARHHGRWLRRVAAVAAAVVLALAAWHYPTLMLRWRADYMTVAGAQSQIMLPDGSRMILNTDSGVSIDFKDGRRDVAVLRGEAWFDVRHDPAHPFRVTGGFGQAVVKGTTFAVRREADRDEVVLEGGRVDVTCLCQAAARVVLRPGQGVTINKAGPQDATPMDASVRLAWRDGRIMFEDVPLGDVVDELARYYGGTILVPRERTRSLIVTGNYRLDNIEAALRTLADAAGVQMVRIPGGLIILR